MPRLVDTTIRLLGQDPLAGSVSTSDLLDLAEVLDGAGFAYLEVSGGGTFDSAVSRGVESPWERIRALDARTKTPLALAVRGAFLVGSRPVGGDLVRRFIASAATNGIDVFRLHDPLNDVENLRDAADAILGAGCEFEGGIVYGSARHESLIEAAKRIPELGATRILLDDPAGLLQPGRAGELIGELGELSGLPVGLYSQGAGRNGLAAAMEAGRAGVDVIACAIYPVALAVHRVSAESAAQALAGIGLDTGVDIDTLWRAADLVEEHIGDAPVAPLVPRIAVRAAKRKLPAAIVAAVDAQLQARDAGGRLDEVLDEVERVRVEAGSPALSSPMGQIVGSQALVNVLGSSRYGVILDELRDLVRGDFGRTPGPIDPALARAVDLLAEVSEADPPVDLDTLREEAKGLASSEEELLLLALFGDAAEPLLRSIRNRSAGTESLEGAGLGEARTERIREVVRIVQESGIEEITVEEEGLRVSVRRSSDRPSARESAPANGGEDEWTERSQPSGPEPPDEIVRVESPLVGIFYRSSEPGKPPLVEEGEAVAAGQTLCILEAMKLMNEVKAPVEAIVRKIHVANAEPVEYGQLLLELEPLDGRPPDAA